MKIEIDNQEYEIVINKKRTTKNIYLRVKEDLKIYVNTNMWTSDKEILRVINKNEKSIIRMIERVKKKLINKEKFCYLGKEYSMIYTNLDGVTLGDDKVFINQKYDVNKWYKEMAKDVFQKELDKIYQSFPYKIPYPSLTIREMKTRWGVCNTKLKRVTLNLELIKKDVIYLDYVIVHELSHLIYPNHSKDFWRVVMEVMPDCKVIRKELRYDE